MGLPGSREVEVDVITDAKQAVLAAIYVTTRLTEDDREKLLSAFDNMTAFFLKERFGIGLIVSAAMRLIVSIAAEQRWTKEQLFEILEAIYADSRPGADKVYEEERQGLG